MSVEPTPPMPHRVALPSARYSPPASDPRLASLLSDLEVRLRPVLGDMEPDARSRILRDIAAMKLRWMEQELGRA